MLDPLVKTFEVLATTKAAASIDVLLAAVDSPHLLISDRAVVAMLQRGTTRSQTEVLRRMDKLPPVSRKRVEAAAPRLSGSLRQCLLHGDADLRGNALAFVASAEIYDQVHTLLLLLRQADEEERLSVFHTLLELVNRMHERCYPQADGTPETRVIRNIGQLRHAALTSLEEACNQFDSTPFAADLVECVLILGEPDNFAVRKALLQGPLACREVAGRLLKSSRHPGVMRLLVEFMGQPYPPVKAFEAIESRTDPEFINFLLRTFPKRVGENRQKNFKQIAKVAWLDESLVALEVIPPGLHAALVWLVRHLGVPAAQKSAVQEWMLRHGSREGRAAASEILETLAPEAVRGILFNGLDSADEETQAWATSRLRGAGIPEAFRLLLEKLDSPLGAVREAARGELGSFNLGLLLGLFDHLDPQVCLRAGRLLRKTDPGCIAELSAEINSSVQRRRARAIHAADALGLARDVQNDLIRMLQEPDTLLRRSAAEVLGGVPTADVLSALLECSLNDGSPRVRESAEQSLLRLRQFCIESEASQAVSDRHSVAEGEAECLPSS